MSEIKGKGGRTIENKFLEEFTSIDNFHTRSEVSQEIISKKPGFIEKWALFVFLCILLLLTTGTWFIRYPDIIQTRAILSADDAPKEIIPLQTGRLIRLFVQNGQNIEKGDTIGWIESTAAPEEVLKLSALLDSSVNLLSAGKPDRVSPLFVENFHNLGSIQSPYQIYVSSIQEFNDYLVNGFYARQKDIILNDIRSIDDMDSTLKNQRQLTEQDNELSKQSYEMNQKLYKEKVISLNEYRIAQSALLNKQMAIPQINSNILSNQNLRRDKLKELEHLEHDVSQQRITFEQALQTLISDVDSWKHQYLLKSPLKGVIYFTQPIQQNQFVEQGKILGYINPPDTKFYAQLFLPQPNLGKIKIGMEVQLRFDAYPYEETGFLRGKISYISRVSSDSGYLSIVKFDDGLKTNLKQKIQYKNGLKADALIITKNMRLLERLYYNVVKATSPGN